MAKTNYNKMSNKPQEDVKTETEVVAVVEETVTETEPVIEKKPEKKPEKKVKKGIVVDCTKLNMRVAPKVDAKIRGTLDRGTTVIILGEEGDFYKIGNPENPDYCMKKYISVK